MLFKKTVFIFLLAFSLAGIALAQDFPAKPSRLVNDYTNTLSQEQINALEQKLVAFDDSSSTQIAVVLIKSVGGYDIADYTARLGEKWGVGRDKKNNGLVLLAALGDRKISIQTGYGLEGALPDAIARRIIENEIKPSFRDGDYYGGLDKATDAIIAYTKGEYKNEEPRNTRGSSGGGVGVGFIIFIIIIVIISIISKRGGGGGGGQIFGDRGGASPFWWMLMGSQMGRGSGGSGWGGSGGGGWSGGGGGGFGGFGGGSFGGGGASGSW